jgi:hypothetical protein
MPHQRALTNGPRPRLKEGFACHEHFSCNPAATPALQHVRSYIETSPSFLFGPAHQEPSQYSIRRAGHMTAHLLAPPPGPQNAAFQGRWRASFHRLADATTASSPVRAAPAPVALSAGSRAP